MAQRPFRLGLTGGIGSGKSTVAGMLRALGAAIIDADAISRATTAPSGAAMPAIAALFGPDFVAADGGLDRQRMRAAAFADAQARLQLESIVHPLVSAEIDRQGDAAQAQGSPTIVYEIPLLLESGRWAGRLDAVLVVDCREDTQVARVMARSGLAPPQIASIMAAQAPRAQRLAGADAVLYNDGLDLAALEDAVHRIAPRFGL